MNISLLAHTEGGHGWGCPFEPWELHPALNHLPIAFLLGGVAVELYAWWRRRPTLSQSARGLLIVGVLTGAATWLAGVLAFWTVPAHTEEAHRLMYWHAGLQTLALMMFAWPTWRYWRNCFTPPTTGSRVVLSIAAALLLVGSATGGYLVYHGGAGVDPDLLAPAVRQSHAHDNREEDSHEHENTAEPKHGH